MRDLFLVLFFDNLSYSFQSLKLMKFFSLIPLLISLFCYAADRKPNFIYIMVDDAGYGDFSCFGQKKFKTPSVDRMAREGMKLTDFYASSTVCAPSRASLMTGLHTGHGYIRGNKEIKPEGQHPLPAKAETIPEVLKSAGYVSGMFGKCCGNIVIAECGFAGVLRNILE